MRASIFCVYLKFDFYILGPILGSSYLHQNCLIIQSLGSGPCAVPLKLPIAKEEKIHVGGLACRLSPSCMHMQYKNGGADYRILVLSTGPPRGGVRRKDVVNQVHLSIRRIQAVPKLWLFLPEDVYSCIFLPRPCVILIPCYGSFKES